MVKQYVLTEEELSFITDSLDEIKNTLLEIKRDEQLIKVMHSQSKDRIYSLSSGIPFSIDLINQIKDSIEQF
jgi:hypothetical protein